MCRVRVSISALMMFCNAALVNAQPMVAIEHDLEIKDMDFSDTTIQIQLFESERPLYGDDFMPSSDPIGTIDPILGTLGSGVPLCTTDCPESDCPEERPIYCGPLSAEDECKCWSLKGVE